MGRRGLAAQTERSPQPVGLSPGLEVTGPRGTGEERKIPAELPAVTVRLRG